MAERTEIKSFVHSKNQSPTPMFQRKKLLRDSFCLFLLTSVFMTAQAQENINYNESKVPPYTLPDPLKTKDGKNITTTQQWMREQRPVWLALFAENVYGRMPGKPVGMDFKVSSVDSSALN